MVHIPAKMLGEPLDHKGNYLDQIFTFLLIIGKSVGASAASEHYEQDYILNRPAHVWTNVILSVGKYLITFCCDDGICPNAMHARGVATQRAEPGIDLLMRFYLMLGQAIDVTRTSALPYWKYLFDAKGWSAFVTYSTMDDPPPYLGSIAIDRGKEYPKRKRDS